MLVCVTLTTAFLLPFLSHLTWHLITVFGSSLDKCLTHTLTLSHKIPWEKLLLYPFCFHLIFHPPTAGLMFYWASHCQRMGCTTLCTIIYKWPPINRQCLPLCITLAKQALLVSLPPLATHAPWYNTLSSVQHRNDKLLVPDFARGDESDLS